MGLPDAGSRSCARPPSNIHFVTNGLINVWALHLSILHSMIYPNKMSQRCYELYYYSYQANSLLLRQT